MRRALTINPPEQFYYGPEIEVVEKVADPENEMDHFACSFAVPTA